VTSLAEPALPKPPPTLQERMLHGPILSTLGRLAAPNAIAMTSATIVSVAETTYVGLIGTPALAGVTLVFPVVMLNQMMSGGAMGGGVSSAVARALGADDQRASEALPFCAFAIAAAAGLGFAVLIWAFGPAIFRLLGGRGQALEAAVAYGRIVAFGLLFVWLSNMMASIMRGSGRMAPPAVMMLASGLLQVIVGGTLGLGLFGAPRLGIEGVALGQLVAFVASAIAAFVLLRLPRLKVRLTFDLAHLKWRHFADILRVGGIAVFSPIQSVSTVLILTALVARFGTEPLAGYGIGARLEFLLVPIAFSIGIASLPMVGVAIGAREIARARKVAWTAGGVAAVTLGLIGAVVVAAPGLWAGLFTRSPAVYETACQYLRIAGVGFPFMGVGLCLYFASQGSGKVFAPILAQTARLAIVALGGWALAGAGAPITAVFALIAVSMVALGLGAALAVKLTPWG